MSFDLQLQRLASRIASVLALPAWGGLSYTLLHRPHHLSFPVSASLPEVGFLTIATLLCSLLAFVCTLPALAHNISSLSTWLFTLVCGLPFFGMLWLLDPAGVTPLY